MIAEIYARKIDGQASVAGEQKSVTRSGRTFQSYKNAR